VECGELKGGVLGERSRYLDAYIYTLPPVKNFRGGYSIL